MAENVSKSESASSAPNQELFANAVRENYARIYLLAYSTARDSDTANDLAQETFLRAWLKFDTLRDTNLLGPWLIRIVQNLAWQWHRTGRSRSRVLPLMSLEEIVVDPTDQQTPNPRDTAQQKEHEEQLHEAVMELPQDLRDAVLLHYGDGLSISDMARLTGEAPSTISRRLSRAHEHLRNFLKSGNALPLAALRPGPASTAQALSLIAAASALPAITHAALLSAITDTPLPPSIPTTNSATSPGASAKATPMKIFGTQFGIAKIAAAILIAGAAIGGGTYLTSNTKTSLDTKTHNNTRATITAKTEGTNDAAKTRTQRLSADSRGNPRPRPPRRATSPGGPSEHPTNSPDKTTSTPSAQTPVAPGDATTSAAIATITGTILDPITSQPIAGALVRAAADAPDMRSIRKDQNKKSWPETHTDASGRYSIELTLKDGPTSVALDAFMPGYRSLAGTLMSGGDFTAANIPIAPGQTITKDLTLPAALYVAGQVVDENGKPLANIQLKSTVELKHGMAYVSNMITDQKGNFEIFDFPLPGKDGDITAGVIELKRDDLVTTFIKDIYAVSETQQRNLKIVMSSGTNLTGQLLTAAGEPATSVPLHIQYGQELRQERRDVTTDHAGNFELRGLPAGHANLYARSIKTHQVMRAEITVPTSNSLTLQMVPMPTTDKSKAVQLLGMTLIDVTPELATAYDLYKTTGVLILDAGTGPDRINSPSDETRKYLSEGSHIFLVGKKSIPNLHALATEVLRVNQMQKPEGWIQEGYKGCIRIAYNWPQEYGNFSATQYMNLSPADIQELEQYLTSNFPPPAPRE